MIPHHLLFGLLAFLPSLAASQSIPVSTFCTPQNTLCASINLPSTNNDTFFQITAPTSSGWAGIGIGDQMAGSWIFVMYRNSAGDGVVVSPRKGVAHVMPEYSSDIDITLLEGSGVKNDVMTANFKCSNCRPPLVPTSTTTGFIYAFGGSRQQLQSDSLTATFGEHAQKGNFRLDLLRAIGGDGGENPFTSGGRVEVGGGGKMEGGKSTADRVVVAHGTLMSLVFLLLLPLGSLLPRTLSHLTPHAIPLHRALQLTSFLIVLVALAMGVWVCGERRTHLKSTHHKIGITVPILLLLQASLGQLHHTLYSRSRHTNSRLSSLLPIINTTHRILGPATIFLGVINGGLGLREAAAGNGPRAGYAVVGVMVAVGVVAAAVWVSRRGGREREGKRERERGWEMERR